MGVGGMMGVGGVGRCCLYRYDLWLSAAAPYQCRHAGTNGAIIISQDNLE